MDYTPHGFMGWLFSQKQSENAVFRVTGKTDMSPCREREGYGDAVTKAVCHTHHPLDLHTDSLHTVTIQVLHSTRYSGHRISLPKCRIFCLKPSVCSPLKLWLFFFSKLNVMTWSSKENSLGAIVSTETPKLNFIKIVITSPKFIINYGNVARYWRIKVNLR